MAELNPNAPLALQELLAQMQTLSDLYGWTFDLMTIIPEPDRRLLCFGNFVTRQSAPLQMLKENFHVEPLNAETMDTARQVGLTLNQHAMIVQRMTARLLRRLHGAARIMTHPKRPWPRFLAVPMFTEESAN